MPPRRPSSLFLDRVRQLPRLGLGVSTEHGAGKAPGALDLGLLRDMHPSYAEFLEIGIETAKGIDDDARDWTARCLPTTYHYLDINLDEPEDFDAEWLDDVRRIASEIRPACSGDVGSGRRRSAATCCCCRRS
jgi:hypothetical protein